MPDKPVHIDDIMLLVLNEDQSGITKLCADLNVNRASLAHYLVSQLPWDELSKVLPYPTSNNLTGSGWVRSLKERKSVTSDGQPVPWFTYPALEFLFSLVQPNWRVFEWGSGQSTLWWSQHVREVIAVEDDPAWARDVESRMGKNVTLLKHSVSESYVDSINAFPDHYFDVIVVDGSHRSDCARLVRQKLSPAGFIIFDNSEDPAYGKSIDDLSSSLPLRLDYWGLIPCYLYKSCTSFFISDTRLLQAAPPPYKHRSELGESGVQSLEAFKETLLALSSSASHAPG